MCVSGSLDERISASWLRRRCRSLETSGSIMHGEEGQIVAKCGSECRTQEGRGN